MTTKQANLRHNGWRILAEGTIKRVAYEAGEVSVRITMNDDVELVVVVKAINVPTASRVS